MAGKHKTGSIKGRNLALAGVLAELGWSLNRAAAEVNAYMGQGYLARTSVSEWVTNGRVPREPLPTVVAYLLSNAAGRQVTVAELWGGGVKESAVWLPADHGQQLSWDYPGVLYTAGDWISNTGRTMDTDRRQFMAISGAALTGIAWAYLNTATSAANLGANAATARSMTITPGLVDALETTISGLRKLDAVEGGDPHTLRLAHHHFQVMAEYVKSGNTIHQYTRQRLLDAWADLCHICGWMAIDAGQHGLAQRYYLTGLQVTKITGNRELGAHFLGGLSQQASQRGLGKDASELADAAVAAAKDTRPIVQSCIWSRVSEAQAVMGNAYGCRSAIDRAHDLAAYPGAQYNKPHWMYWFDTAALQSRSGWITLALTQNSSRSRTPTMFRVADSLLAPHTVADLEFPRDRLVNASWLARSYVWRDELEQAVDTGASCLRMLGGVHSPRVAGLLHEFTIELAQHRGALKNPHIATFTRELQATLI